MHNKASKCRCLQALLFSISVVQIGLTSTFPMQFTSRDKFPCFAIPDVANSPKASKDSRPKVGIIPVQSLDLKQQGNIINKLCKTVR